MKKFIAVFVVLLLYPLNLIAYSSQVIPGGENIGISINTEGLVVVGFYKVENRYIGKDNLKIGDVILEINGKEVSSLKDMTEIMGDSIKEDKVEIKVKRNKNLLNTTLNLVKTDNIYRTGLYVKDKVAGIGTLTYIDPITKIYGALGHEIVLNETNTKVEIKDGSILESRVNSIDRSTNGNVGSKNATINYKNIVGTVEKNTVFGLFGNYTATLPNKDTLTVAEFNEIELGEAKIYTIVEKNSIAAYTINITKIDKGNQNTTKAFSFEIVDKKLLEKTGGVVQGMSGSPIIQNNKIIGAVTHVVVEDIKKGYGIYIKTMLSEGER